MYGCDSRWWAHHIGDITRGFDGKCYTQDVQWTKESPAEQWGIETLTSLDKPGLSTEQGTVHRGGNSGYQAVNLAYLLGGTRIILLGFDMMMSGTQRHWFGDHPNTNGMNAASNYGNFMRAFATIKPEEYGIEIWNCTRQTALACFPRYKLEDL